MCSCWKDRGVIKLWSQLNSCYTEIYHPVHTIRYTEQQVANHIPLPNHVWSTKNYSRLKLMIKSLVTPVCILIHNFESHCCWTHRQTNWLLVQVCDCKIYRQGCKTCLFVRRKDRQFSFATEEGDNWTEVGLTTSTPHPQPLLPLLAFGENQHHVGEFDSCSKVQGL